MYLKTWKEFETASYNLLLKDPTKVRCTMKYCHSLSSVQLKVTDDVMHKMLNWGKKKRSQILHPKYSDFHSTYEKNENKKQFFRIIRFDDKEQPKKKSNFVFTSKYGIISFLPLFFIEQLQYFPTQYSLFVASLQQIPYASPSGRFTTIVPLCFKVIFSAIKSIIKDVIRHIADYRINRKRVEVFRNGVLIQEKWSEIGVGDIIKVINNKMFPADLLLLSSSERYGTCRIETANLDDEIDLKIRQCPKETSCCRKLQDIVDLNGTIECELPNKLLYHFLGRLTTITNNYAIPLDNKQFLPRGAYLRSTKWIYGVVIYTGHETKLMLNQTSYSLKESSMDSILISQNKVIFLLVLLLSLVCSIYCTWWTKRHFKTHWYLELKDYCVYEFVVGFISFFILFQGTNPITLHSRIHLVHLLQAWFIKNDIDIYHEESNTPAMARSPNLNVELGKVKHLFSDKTGTLTKNEMKLKHYSIAGELYLEGSQNKISNNLNNHATNNYILEFLRMTLICHTVFLDKMKHTNEIVYNGSSADEQALVLGSQRNGFKFHTRGPNSVIITTSHAEEHYEILNIIEFTNSRKRMSVIVRTPDSQIKLYCKGADTAIFKRLSKSGETYRNQSIVHLNNFARAGYRTLCFAYVDISESFYKTWKDEYLKASAVLTDRNTAINQVAKKIEKELTLLGVTAIENKLQDDVPNTIQTLMNASLKIWLLTGDKQETAISIGFSTRLITKDSSIITLNESKLTDFRNAIQQWIHDLSLKSGQKTKWTLVIDGRSLKHALSDDIKMDFLKLCIECKSIICCRISSTQKSEIVDLVTKNTKEVTLAIGDGANDVSMLNKANIGVGVLGLKGLQASNASDYSIGQFKYLSKLLLVHGASNYERISKMIYFSYYKYILFYALQLWFEIYSGWSSQMLFDRWNICMYTLIFTAAPPLVIGLFRTMCQVETRLNYPQLYTQTRHVFNYRMFSMWIIIAMFHSIILFWMFLFIVEHEVIWSNGRVGDYSVMGNIIYTCAVVIVCVKAGLHVQSWSFIVYITVILSILSWFLFIIVYSKLQKLLLMFSISMNLNEIILRSSLFWITIIITTITILMIDLVVIIIMQTLCKNNDEIMNKIEKIKTTRKHW